MRNYLESEIKEAVNELGFFAIQQASKYGLAFNAKFKGSVEEQSFAEMRSDYHDAFITGKQYIMSVSVENNDQTVYELYSDLPGHVVNMSGRFWHDMIHLEFDRNFTTESEIFVAGIQLHEAKLDGLSALAQKLLWADTVGQQMYHKRYNKFPVNQLAFCTEVVQRGLTTALKAKY